MQRERSKCNNPPTSTLKATHAQQTNKQLHTQQIQHNMEQTNVVKPVKTQPLAISLQLNHTVLESSGVECFFVCFWIWVAWCTKMQMAINMCCQRSLFSGKWKCHTGPPRLCSNLLVWNVSSSVSGSGGPTLRNAKCC